MLKILTTQYIKAFDTKDIKSIEQLLSKTFALEDPVVKRIEGKREVLKAIQSIFDSCEKLNFKAKNIYQDHMTTIIEFILQLDETILTGTDIIEWNEQNQMTELRAYLDIPK
ncbi:MAG: nuclear transport factor 2 family protein [Sulfuricurvum sp.]|uniref:nuclear transport factor 2 family protein n=1 Tax=Sulfuricurvum sp. TaxID=2025608 RepID=UPI00261DD0B1|nr:nuclear transport factor 2 family protein [Sulfuricurvum sp.]MDD2367941.1 nuclear transport factor 2 family protein [Sulfuricurvum sp.]MDD5117479.1 nuclear transport factor 2 family protein [Sulfuricurvum sp.]